MAEGNPDILIPLLDDLIDRIKFWKSKSSEVLDDGNYRQSNADNVVSRASSKTKQIRNQANEDSIRVQEKQDETYRIHLLYESQLVSAQALEHRSLQIKEEAAQTVAVWENRLNEALMWLDQAKRELSTAQHDLGNAQMYLSDMRRALSSAGSALESCRNSGHRDKDGRYHAPNCSSQERQLAEAQRGVREAQNRVTEAQGRVNRAAAEVRKAEEQVKKCRKALGIAKQAHQVAVNGVVTAQQAVNHAERTVEESSAALRNCDRTQELASQANDLSEQMGIHAKQAKSNNTQAKALLRKADESHSSAYNYATMGEHDVENRLEALRDFAAPADFPGGDIASSSFTQTPANNTSSRSPRDGKPLAYVENQLAELEKDSEYVSRILDETVLLFGDDAINLGEEEILGGHSIKYHGPQISDFELRKRVEKKAKGKLVRKTSKSFKFKDERSYITSCNEIYSLYHEDIIRHFISGGKKVNIVHPLEYSIGEGFTRQTIQGKKQIKKQETNVVSLTLIRDESSPRGFKMITYYPLENKNNNYENSEISLL